MVFDHHANAMQFQLFDEQHLPIAEEVYFFVGRGFVEKESEWVLSNHSTMNASITGAKRGSEVGVGVGCSMVAAGLTAAMGTVCSRLSMPLK